MATLTRNAAIEIIAVVNGFMVRYASSMYKQGYAETGSDIMVFETIESLIIFLRLHFDGEG